MSARFSWLPGHKALEAAAAQPTVAKVATTCLSLCVSSHEKGFGWRSGDLARSYTAVPAGPAQWVVGTNIYYAPFVEYGTRFMPAQSHLRRAAATTASMFPGVTWVGGR